MLKLIKKEFIFDEPTPVPECHASTILKLDNGNILAAWFGGTKEAHMDTLIWVSLRENGRWSPPRPVTPEVSVQHWNPVLFQRADGSILLFYKLGYPISQWHTRVIASTDGGKTWSMPNELVPGDRTGGRGPVKNKCLRLSDGRILAPGSTEDLPWRCFIDASDDDGETWIKRPIAVGAPHGNEIFLIQPTLWEHPAGHIHALMRSNRGRIFRSDSSDFGENWVGAPHGNEIFLIQPTLWEHPAGHIHALMRSNRGRIFRSDSSDFGENWSPAMPTDMPNNNSGIDCVRMESGSIVLAYNPVGENWGARCPLSIAVSHDDGATFQRVMDIETEPCPSGYCYPAIVADGCKLNWGARCPLSIAVSHDDGATFQRVMDIETEPCPSGYCYPAIVADGCKLYLSYTWNRRKIAFCELEEIE